MKLVATKEMIRKAIFKFEEQNEMGWNTNFDELALMVLDRIDFDNESDDDTIRDLVFDAMDNSLFYTEDQWKMMMLYQEPKEADFDNAWCSFESDLIEIVEILKEMNA